MAAGAWQVYAVGIQNIADGDIDLDLANNLRMTLVTSAYTPSRSTHDTWSDVSTNEVANGGGYATHGKVLTSTVTIPTGETIMFDCDDQSWTSSTITAKYAVIVEDGNQDGVLAGGDLLVAYCDLETGGGSVSTTNGTFQISIHANGVFRVSQT